ncbi:MAG: GNAT family N-acetyltransferase [Aureliella sp.]
MPSNSTTIRLATYNDAETIAQFNCAIAQETEGKSLDEALVLSGVRRGIDRGPEVRYFVADKGGQLVGCLMITREWSDWRDGWIIWIQSVYVAADFRGQGIFKLLLQSASEIVKQEPDTIGLRLYVELENARAQEVYLRTGFADPNYKVLEKMF